MRRSAHALVLLFFAASTASCAPKAAPRPSTPPPSAPAVSSPAACPPLAPASDFGADVSFALDKADLRANGASPALLTRLEQSSHQYFRALAQRFAQRTCAAFRDVRWHLPVSAVHGDAHVEQFVVTPTTYGLEDFDQAGFGPAIIDLVRYAASIHLACREVTWACRADAAVAAYFDAYRASLDSPVRRREPAAVARLRRSTPQDMRGWLAWADLLMLPLTPGDEAIKRRGWADLVRVEASVHPDRPAAFYDVVRVGGLQMGTGSALETKILFRIRGATAAPDDDVVVEGRSMTEPTGTECAWRPRHGSALMPLFFMSLLSARMPDVYGTAVLDSRLNVPEFWMQAWEPGYRELAIADLAGQEDLVELAEDAGRQLAGHFWDRFPARLRSQQRAAQLRAFDLVNARGRALARDFAAEVVLAWERFRAAQ